MIGVESYIIDKRWQKQTLVESYHQRCNYIVPGILRWGGGDPLAVYKKGGTINSQK